jgi:glycosyltransferase involved in cell wall biosynthesis
MSGGIQRVFLNLARGFLEHGLAVDLVQATPENEMRDQVPAGVRLVDLNAHRALASLWPLVRYLRRERPDAMICGAIQTNIAAIWARRLSGVPTKLILTEHNVVSVIAANARTLRAKVTPWFVRRFYPWAEELVAVSHGAAADLACLLGIPVRKIRVIYNPIIGPDLWNRIEEPLEHAWFAEGQKPVLIAVGRLHYHKDYPTLLRAFAILRKSVDCRVMFLGDGEERGNLEALARELGVEANVLFAGTVPNPLPYMRRAAVLVLSSIVESLSIALIEGLAAGVPIVATDCPVGPREVLMDGAYGTLVPVGDPVAMAGAVKEVLQSPRPRMSKDNLQRFEHRAAVEAYLNLLTNESVGLPFIPDTSSCASYK